MANNQNFFADMMKMFENNPVTEMFKNLDSKNLQMVDMNQMINLQKNNAENMINICQSSIADCQAIMKKCGQMVQKNSNEIMHAQREMTSSMTNAEKSPEKMVEKMINAQSQNNKKLFENFAADAGEILEMVQKSNMDIYKTICNKMAQTMEESMNVQAPKANKKAATA